MKNWSFGHPSALVALALTATALTATIGGCKKDEGAAADAGPDAAVTNESDITRYPYETKLANVSATIVNDSGAVAHKSPPDGPTVATIAKGATVTELAQANHAFLVTFTDTSDGNKTKMGWITDAAFSNAPPDAGVAVVQPNHVMVHHDAGPVTVVNGPATTKPVLNGCGVGYVMGPHDKMCHKQCNTTTDCGGKACNAQVCD